MGKKTKKNTKNKETSFVLDEKDRKIISVLSNDARCSIAEISKKTGIKRDSIAYRIEKMQKAKVISFPVLLDYKKAGYGFSAIIMLALQNFSPEKEKLLWDFLDNEKNVVSYFSLSGKNDCLIRVVSKNQEEFSYFVRELRAKFSPIIKDISIDNIIEERKNKPEKMIS